MSVARINVRCMRKTLKPSRCYSTAVSPLEDEYTKTPQYPKILDLSRFHVRKREMQECSDSIKAVKTIEEKQIKLNMPKYYGFKTFLLSEEDIPYDNLSFTQHVTKTHLIVNDQLPLGDLTEGSVNFKALRDDIEEVLILGCEGYKKGDVNEEKVLNKRESENLLSSILVQQIHRAVFNNLLGSFPHLRDTQFDIDPRIESSWYVGGVSDSGEAEKNLGVNDKVFHYSGQPLLTIRSELPLEPQISLEEAEKSNFDVPRFEYSPHTVGIFKDRRRIVNVPGFWPGDTHQFGLMSYHKRGHMLHRTFSDDHLDGLHRQGMLASFSWLNAQANFLGFNTYNDLTYPLLTQTIITNGQIWSFYVYQLNTMLIHRRFGDENPRNNICWATNEFKLFEEIKDQKVIGFNDDVLKLLVKLYANVPKVRSGVELRPYLSKEEQVIADYADDDKRQWLEREYKFITSNRPRYQLPYEIYHWEKIYKIDHKRRIMDARRRPFELFINPWNRRYDERKPFYIPRKLRPDVKKHVGRDAKEYFP
ncbi:hypothetical protein FQR65_LT04781 [Abscondita terminalis]|nr:hypothetical protein FQR65_LT04781 [Abscondita terminalis]